MADGALGCELPRRCSAGLKPSLPKLAPGCHARRQRADRHADESVEDCRSMAPPPPLRRLWPSFCLSRGSQNLPWFNWPGKLWFEPSYARLGWVTCKIARSLSCAGSHDIEFEGWRFLLRETAQIRS